MASLENVIEVSKKFFGNTSKKIATVATIVALGILISAGIKS